MKYFYRHPYALNATRALALTPLPTPLPPLFYPSALGTPRPEPSGESGYGKYSIRLPGHVGDGGGSAGVVSPRDPRACLQRPPHPDSRVRRFCFIFVFVSRW